MENKSAVSQKEKSFWQSDNKFFAVVKEWLRKQIVGLKRYPSKIPTFFLALTMTIYMFGTNSISYASMALDVPNGGLIAFWSTLLSILASVLYLNVYPKREKMRVMMLVLTFVFLVVLFVLDVFYYIGILDQLATGIYDSSKYIATFYQARDLMIVHMVFLIISIILCSALSLYAKLLKKIDTSVAIEKSEMIESAHILEGEIE